jgi:hypothetical protein
VVPDPDFVNALCDWLAARAGLQRSAAPYELFAHGAEEQVIGGVRNHADTYTVLRAYGGDVAGKTPTIDRSLQAYTVGPIAAVAMAQSQAVHDALLAQREPDDDGHTPVFDQQIQGWFILAIGNLRQPGLIGRDTQQRAEVVFNFEVVYRAAA